MNRQHSIVVTGRDLAAILAIGACFVAGAALIGFAVGKAHDHG